MWRTKYGTQSNTSGALPVPACAEKHVEGSDDGQGQFKHAGELVAVLLWDGRGQRNDHPGALVAVDGHTQKEGRACCPAHQPRPPTAPTSIITRPHPRAL